MTKTCRSRVVRTVLCAAVSCLASGVARAQATPPAAAAAAPAKPRYVLEMPPGFQKVTVAGHTALCEPADVEWVTKALTASKPGTRPTTMPTDLLERATASRAQLLAKMTADLALPDDKAPADFYNNKLLATLRKFDDLQAPVFFLVLTRERLDALAKSGWGEPRFHYNRVADKTSFDDNVMLSLERPMDDSILPAFYTTKDAPDERVKKLSAGVAELDTKLARLISGQAQLQVFNLFSQWVGETQFEPLKLRRDQQWVSMGSAAYLAAGYAAQLTGIPKDLWLADASFDPPRSPLPARSIDLLNPVDESKMKPGAVPFYTQAMRRKSVSAVMALTAKGGGDAAIAKVLAALRKGVPADGAGLVKLIKDATGADVAGELAPK